MPVASQRRPNTRGIPTFVSRAGVVVPRSIAVEKGKLLRILDVGAKEAVEGTGTLELIEPPHRCKHLLPDLPLLSPVLYNLEIFSRAYFFVRKNISPP